MNFQEILSDGSKTYTELRGTTPKDLFDIELSLALKSGKIVKALDGSGRYTLPVKQPKDEPLMPLSHRVKISIAKKPKRKMCLGCNDTWAYIGRDYCQRCIYRRKTEFKIRLAMGKTVTTNYEINKE